MADSDPDVIPDGSPTEHLCKTPYYAIQARRRTPGKWDIAYFFARFRNEQSQQFDHIETLVEQLRRSPHPTIVRCEGLDRTRAQIQWAIDIPRPIIPLSFLNVPMPSSVVVQFVRSLLITMEHLHGRELGCYDLAPGTVFSNSACDEVMIIPAPWLPMFARNYPARLQELRFIAPELLDAGRRQPETVKADLYALGLLTWYTLVGRHRPRASQVLPSDVNSELTEWDPFIEGLCGRRIELRFSSIEHAREALPRSR